MVRCSSALLSSHVGDLTQNAACTTWGVELRHSVTWTALLKTPTALTPKRHHRTGQFQIPSDRLELSKACPDWSCCSAATDTWLDWRWPLPSPERSSLRTMVRGWMWTSAPAALPLKTTAGPMASLTWVPHSLPGLDFVWKYKQITIFNLV